MPRYGMVCFSFALRAEDEEPNPCNIRLAKVAERIVDELGGEEVVVVAQWEIARQLRADGYVVAKSVELPADGSYLGSEDVWEDAKDVFKYYDIEKSICPVANPFLHLTKVKKMIVADGWWIIDRKIGRIGFDKLSTQWWTRGPLRLLLYAVLQKLTGLRGHHGHQKA